MTPRRANFSAGSDLVTAAIALATASEPWAEEVLCSVDDFVAAGLSGEYLRVPVPRPQSGSAAELFTMTTYPGSPERMAEDAERFRQNTHFLALRPVRHIPRGALGVPAERQRRLYSCGYYAGQWCAPHAEALADSREKVREAMLDRRLAILGALDYAEGFEDGWHGRPPRLELRLADLACYEARVGSRPEAGR